MMPPVVVRKIYAEATTRAIFTPVSRTYPALVNNQTDQNYDALVLGDVASHFAE